MPFALNELGMEAARLICFYGKDAAPPAVPAKDSMRRIFSKLHRAKKIRLNCEKYLQSHSDYVFSMKQRKGR
jgi:hypothetical protein